MGKQFSSVNVAKTIGEVICCRIPLQIQTKMEPRWEADGVFLGKLDLSDEVIVGTPKGIETTRSFKRMTDRQWNPGTLRMFVGVPWNPRGIITDSPGRIRKRYITRALMQTHGAQDGCAPCPGDAQVHVLRCRKRFEDIFDQEKLPGQPREVVQQDEPGRAAEEILPSDHCAQMEHEPHSSALISELCERDVPEIDWEKLAVDNSSVYDVYTGLRLDEGQVKAGRETEV